MMKLAVELAGCLVGTLEGDPRTFDFTSTAEAIETFGLNSTALSVSIPFVKPQKRGKASLRRNWFAELLPEGDQYDHMLQQSNLRVGDTLGFLARYGRDIAGALQIWDVDDPTEPQPPEFKVLTDAGIRKLLEDPLGAPLANAPISGKSSLGGVQPKIVLAKTDTDWAQVFGGYPSTHILKPQLQGELASVIFDEEYGSRLAKIMQLANFGVEIQAFDGLPALIIERFDRSVMGRVHQEDFNQILGASGNEKYQEMGGVVNLRRVADVLTRHAAANELHRLARMVILTVAVGNLDMHTKNIGLLHLPHHEVALTPMYDVVPQAHMQNDGRLALAVNKKYAHDTVRVDDLEAEFSSWGIRKAKQIVSDALDELEAAVLAETPLAGAFAGLQEQILFFIERLRE